jgi:ABC-2 type transport system ATP-binding protein
MAASVEVRDLRVAFGTVIAVNGLDLTLPAGSAVALVGRNGAGKSTSLRVLAGVIPPTWGQVRIMGFDIATDRQRVKEHVGYCPDVGGLIPRATPWEHLSLSARLRGIAPGWEPRARDLIDRFDLGGAVDRVTASFSHGMSRRMSVLLAAFHQPDVLLLDEPFDGVDPLGVDATMAMIAELRLAGTAVLISTHLLDLAVQACDEAVVLRQGGVAGAAPASELAGVEGAARYRAMLS